MIRLVLVDDHQLFREGIKLMLQSSPDISVVGEAASAQQALELVVGLRGSLDLVIADFGLPDYEAPWLLEQLRKRSVKVPLLMLSQYTEAERVRQVVGAGAYGYLVKTARREELLQAVSIVSAGGVYLHPAVAPAFLNPPASAPEPLLNARQTAIVQLVVEGLSNPAIARRLNLSLGTIKGELQLIFRKMKVDDRSRLVAAALSKNLIEHPS